MTLNQEEEVEAISRMLHAIYQAEAKRQAGEGLDSVRHPDEYDFLPDHTKEYDRVLARYILKREEALWQIVNAAKEAVNYIPGDDTAEPLRVALERLHEPYTLIHTQGGEL